MTHNPIDYTITEAAALIGLAPTTLRDKVTAYEVPHHRYGNVKGVYFTPEDIDEIRTTHARRPRQVRESGRSQAEAVVIPDRFARLGKPR